MSAHASSPLVSVLVPVYNGACYLRESLDSILAQSYRQLEVLVLDDASSDETPEVIASYGDAVCSLRQPRTLGIYANANAGIERARGELIAIYHADDVYLPTMVEREVEFLLRYPDVGAVFASDIFVDAEGREYARLRLPPEVRGNRPLDYATVVNALLTYKNTFLRCPGAMVRASVYREFGGYRQERYRNTADLDMWLRIARRYPIGVLEEHLFKYRHFHGSSGERYHHLRTDPARTLTILDDHLADAAGRVATPRALAAHEAHRAEDALMRSVSHYIRGELPQTRATLRTMKVGDLLGSGTVQRGRLLALWGGLQLLTRLPRSAAVADAFYRHWHAKAPR
ncbi:MAG TPA: glycosyltransferase [Longimicrobiaceae bacterium]|nr:glycosyltransferase [Longimicrobiaceae bacterium]